MQNFKYGKHGEIKVFDLTNEADIEGIDKREDKTDICQKNNRQSIICIVAFFVIVIIIAIVLWTIEGFFSIQNKAVVFSKQNKSKEVVASKQDDIKEVDDTVEQLEIDEIEFCREGFYLVRQKNSFFYFKDGKTIKLKDFPGEQIQNQVFEDGYILDANKDLYYFYYNNDKTDPEIDFLKVSNVDKIKGKGTLKYQHSGPLGDIDSLYDNKTFEFPVYEKNGKLYLAFTNVFLESDHSFSNCRERETGAIIIYNSITEFCLDDAVVQYDEFRFEQSDELTVYRHYIFEHNIEIKRIVKREKTEFSNELDGKIENLMK